ncbi:polysaccharide lyase 8 family protein [Microbacterium maritypicum]|uniref:polysaccharide lyase 8 family protein n=1 Tax=Microbacterium maritypicum TaxID=33918 RepID=UPI00381D7198
MPTPFSRRTFLGAAIAATATLGLVDTVAAAPTFAADLTAAQLLDRRKDFLSGATAIQAMNSASPAPGYKADITAKIAALSTLAADRLSTYLTASNRTALWSDVPLSSSGVDGTLWASRVALTFTRVQEIALAYATPGTAQYNNADVVTTLSGMLDYLTKYFYKNNTYAPGNWWYWEIGIPRTAVDTLVLLGPTVPTAVRDAVLASARTHQPNPTRRGSSATSGSLEYGANLVDKALIASIRGLLDGAESDIIAGRDALSGSGDPSRSVFKYVTSGNGFYADGSYIQHDKIPYAGTYGSVELEGIVQILALLADSPWKVTDTDQMRIYSFIEDTYAPYLINGRIMDTVRGRAVSRLTDQDYYSGHTVMAAVLQLAASAPPEKATRLKSLVKGWTAHYTGPSWTTSSEFKIAPGIALRQAKDASNVTAAAALNKSYLHAASERLVVRRPTWSFAVSSSSTRIGRFEWGNKENAKGWYQGDGVTYLYVQGGDDQFGNNFWQTADALALPGITADTAARTSGLTSGTGIPAVSTTFNGGVAIGDKGACLGNEFAGYPATGSTPTLTGLKSWFAFADSVVCVGTNIKDASGSSVVTIVENRGYEKDVKPTVTLNGSASTLPFGSPSLTFDNWAHIEGLGGYIMLAPKGGSRTRARAWMHRGSGSWDDINQAGASTTETAKVTTRDYVRLDVLHGKNPTAERYAYLILPTASSATTASRSATPTVDVATVDGIGHKASYAGTSFLNFFAAGTVDGVTATGKCSVGWTMRYSTTTVVVSDPSRTSSTVRVTLPFNIRSIPQTDGVTLISANPLTLDVNLSGRRGTQVIIEAVR